MKWISVEDRLPEKGQDGFGVDWFQRYEISPLYTFYWDGFFESNETGKPINITHWMPLPEPPKN